MPDQPPEPQLDPSPQPIPPPIPPGDATKQQPAPAPSSEGGGQSESVPIETKAPVKQPAEPGPSSEPHLTQVGGEGGRQSSTPPAGASQFTKRELQGLDIRGNHNVTTIIDSVGPRDRQAVLDFLVQLPTQSLTDPSISVFSDGDLRSRHEILTTDRCLVVSCTDQALARTAGYALIERIGIDTRRRFLLNFERLARTITPDIYHLTARPLDDEAEVVIVVDATSNNDRAHKFIDSLYSITGSYSKSELHEDFARKKLTVVLTVHPGKLRPEALPFETWPISYLQHLLQPRYPNDYADYERKLLRQRQAGGFWSKSDPDFHKQVLAALAAGTLVDKLKEDQPADMPADAAEMLSEREKPLQLAVLYTAAFYPNLPPNDFSRLLIVFLRDRSTRVPVTIEQKTKEGVKEVTVHREKKLVEMWNESRDEILAECGLITGREPGRAVTFAEVGRRDRVRLHIEERFGSYAQELFTTAWQSKLILDVSDSIARDLRMLTVEMALSYPEQYGSDWLSNAVERLSSKPEDVPLALGRLSDLLREMLARPPLDSAVSGLLERLIQSGRHEFAYTIIRNLRYAPHFDELHWLRQVIDRGSDAVRKEATNYLFNALLRAGTGVYRVLRRLDDWLPALERDVKTYSPSQRAALLVMIGYCTETTRQFALEEYGEWPTRFPLLAVDKTTASADFALLVKLMFHPGLVTVADDGWSLEQAIALALDLISEWVFIIFGVAGEPPKPATTADLTREEVLELLLTQILDLTKHGEDREIRRTMLDAWERSADLYAVAPILRDDGFRRRKEFTWKRNLIRRILVEFRRLARQSRS